MKIYFAHSKQLENLKELYARLGDLKRVEFIFPHAQGNVDVNSKQIINEVDLFLAEVSLPSTGLGIELGRAEAANKPIICVYRSGSDLSSSLKFLTAKFVEYSDPEDLLKKLEIFLK